MATNTMSTAGAGNEYPAAGNLMKMMAEKPLPTIPPETVGLLSSEEATAQAQTVLNQLNSAIAADDATGIANCFYQEQSYWRDQLALTWHLRTFETPEIIAASFLETKSLRGIDKPFAIDGEAQFIVAGPALQFIDCCFTFATETPSAQCLGKVRLLPIKPKSENGQKTVYWRIWILSTWLERLAIQPEDEALLQAPKRDLSSQKDFETEVFIIGGGNGAVALAARLKALGVESVIAERNANIGDNWALRYDSLTFHVPTSFCELPYMLYDKELQTPHLLTKDELAAQLRRYANAFSLNYLTSAKVLATKYDKNTQLWQVTFEDPIGVRTATCKHLVQATGIASQDPYVPNIANPDVYKGVSTHSAGYKNAKQLIDRGAKSVLIIGSANTAFDVLQDCHDGGLQTTMNVRSPTYICPTEYVCDTRSLGVYDPLGIEAGDRLLMTGSACVDAALARDLFRFLASQEPDRYKSVAEAGFPVVDSLDPSVALFSNLVERGGGHYMDIGATKLIADRKVAVKAGVEPVAYTETGLKFSDGTTVDADAIIWCTGFRDMSARKSAAKILGGGAKSVATNGTNGNGQPEHILGPEDIAARLDETWGLDAEGEIRGLWKRQLRLENYWIMGGYTQLHRWHSRTLAVQIKAAQAGILPPAYRETPTKTQ